MGSMVFNPSTRPGAIRTMASAVAGCPWSLPGTYGRYTAHAVLPVLPAAAPVAPVAATITASSGGVAGNGRAKLGVDGPVVRRWPS